MSYSTLIHFLRAEGEVEERRTFAEYLLDVQGTPHCDLCTDGIYCITVWADDTFEIIRVSAMAELGTLRVLGQNRDAGPQ